MRFSGRATPLGIAVHDVPSQHETEQAEQQWYRETVALKHQIIVDVGANVGALSQFFWEAGEGTSRVLSVEPLPQNAAIIRDRIARQRASGWQVAECAASAIAGQVRLGVFRLPDGGWNGVIASGQGVAQTTVSVPALPLSQLAPDATVVKVDIEGHEYEVLDEALPRLSAVHTWALELHKVEGRPLEQALAQLASHGYRLCTAGRRPSAPQGPWISAPISAQLSWAQVPVAKLQADGSVFKMLHVIATRERRTSDGTSA